MKLRKAKTGGIKNQRYNVVKLKDPKVKEEFRLTLRNRFSILEDEAALTIEGFNRVMKETGEEVLGFRKSKKTKRISEETWSGIEERRQIKKKLLDTKSL
ncbi:hypothetical protein DPMN_165719 [Dreissena polymorpha]|uniref:Uncharacterized protein n=2 Tax=Dreissena polymorpha TaxID=45954 RepID=A0A9D4IX93_DREPO|nr:hypothetical protein DPMN_165719 [Dreissena polymorpha]